MSEETMTNEVAEATVDVIDGVAEKFVPNNMLVVAGVAVVAVAVGAAGYLIKKRLAAKNGNKPCKFRAWREGQSESEIKEEVEGDIKVEETDKVEEK